MKQKFIVILMLLILTIVTLYNKSIAAKINPDDYKPTGIVKSSKNFDTKIKKVLGWIRNIGIVTSVIFLMIIGLKTMLGSIEEKTEYKEKLPTFIIGAILFLCCSTIPDIIYNVASNFSQ